MGAVRQPEAPDPAADSGPEPGELVLVDVLPPPVADAASAEATPTEPASEAVQGLVNQYLAELRTDLQTPITLPPPPPAVRRVYGGLAISAALMVAAAAAVAVVIWNTGLPVSSLEGVSAAPGGAACVARQEEVMAALAAYAVDHGAPPPTLDSLRPQYLLDPPADPTTGTPFRYLHDGASALLTCPDHPLAPHVEAHDIGTGAPQG